MALALDNYQYTRASVCKGILLFLVADGSDQPWGKRNLKENFAALLIPGEGEDEGEDKEDSTIISSKEELAATPDANLKSNVCKYTGDKPDFAYMDLIGNQRYLLIKLMRNKPKCFICTRGSGGYQHYLKMYVELPKNKEKGLTLEGICDSSAKKKKTESSQIAKFMADVGFAVEGTTVSLALGWSEDPKAADSATLEAPPRVARVEAPPRVARVEAPPRVARVEAPPRVARVERSEIVLEKERVIAKQKDEIAKQKEEIAEQQDELIELGGQTYDLEEEVRAQQQVQEEMEAKLARLEEENRRLEEENRHISTYEAQIKELEAMNKNFKTLVSEKNQEIALLKKQRLVVYRIAKATANFLEEDDGEAEA